MNKCIDCSKQISYYAKRCRKCMGIYQRDNNNPCYIDGRSNKKYSCKDCKKEISKFSGVYGLGRCQSCATKYNFKINPKLIKNLSNLAKGKVGNKNPNFKTAKPRCIDCGKIVYWQRKRCWKCHQIYLHDRFGNKNPNWKNGLSFEPYTKEFNSTLKSKIRKRDNYTCQKCYITEEEHIIVYGKVLSVHHIGYDKKNCKEENLISLCGECNIRVNANREYWKQYFGRLLKCLKIN